MHRVISITGDIAHPIRFCDQIARGVITERFLAQGSFLCTDLLFFVISPCGFVSIGSTDRPHCHSGRQWFQAVGFWWLKSRDYHI